MALYSWSALYHHTASSLVEPGAMGVYEAMARDCIESVPEFVALDKAETPLSKERFLKADPTETEPWRSIMLRNTPGQAQAGAPVFIAQGTADTTVRPDITVKFADALCKQGARVPTSSSFRASPIPSPRKTACARRLHGLALSCASRK